MKGMLVILSGPSGAGKGRVFKEIAKRRRNVRKVLSVTTRPKRKEDFEKENYIFVSEKEFLEMRENGEFFESVSYDGNLYGTLSIPVEELKERDLFFDKDVRGALSIKKAYPEAITIYIMPRNVKTLNERRGDRGTNRAQISKDEVELAKQLDFLVINDNIHNTVKMVETIIECSRRNSMKNKWNIKFLEEFY